MRFRHHVKSIILPYSTLFRSERREAWAGERVLATTARGQRAEARVTATLLCTSQPSPVLTCTKPSAPWPRDSGRSEEHTSELQSRGQLVCRLLLETKISILTS